MLRVDDLLKIIDSNNEALMSREGEYDAVFASNDHFHEVVGIRPSPAGLDFWNSYQNCFPTDQSDSKVFNKPKPSLIRCLSDLKEISGQYPYCHHENVEIGNSKYDGAIKLATQRHRRLLTSAAVSSGSDNPSAAICTLSQLNETVQPSSMAFEYSPARLELFTQRVLADDHPVVGEKLHLILVVYSPVRFARRIALTKDFIRRIESRHANHVELYIVELAYSDQEYVITTRDNPHHLQLRTAIPLWHKENLINLGVQRLLPSDWKAMAWVDAEIEFESPTWAHDVLKLLVGSEGQGSHHDAVQLFSHAVSMAADGQSAAEPIATGFGYNHQRGLPYKANGKGFWHPGYGWAINRKAYDQVGGLFEYNVLGAGDTVFARSMLRKFNASTPQEKYWGSEGHFRAVLEWQARTEGLRLGYVPGVVRHHFHGSSKNRKYMDRLTILQGFVYDPTIHITKDPDNGIVVPSKAFPLEAVRSIEEYFENRKEDGDATDGLDGRGADGESPMWNTLLKASSQPLTDTDKLHLIVVIPPILTAHLNQRRIRSDCHHKVNTDTPLFLRRLTESINANNKHVELYVVELAYGDTAFQVTSQDDPHHLQLRTTVPAWHKENIINLAVKKLLPSNWDAMAWMEAEMEFESPTWALDTLKLLNSDSKDVVQLFSHAIETECDGTASTIFTGFGYNHERGIMYRENGLDLWHPGYGWAWSRKAYDAMGGLYERNIFGGGEMVQAWALVGYHSSPPSSIDMDYLTPATRDAILQYEAKRSAAPGGGIRVGYVPGVVRRGACHVDFPDFVSSVGMVTDLLGVTIDTSKDFSVRQGDKGLTYEAATVATTLTPGNGPRP